MPQVTLCAVTSVNLQSTIWALQTCLDQIDFGQCLLLTDKVIEVDDARITRVPIAPLRSSRAYSDFMLNALVDHVTTSHCLVVQWDGHVLDAQRWQDTFLSYDYVGASWPQFGDGYDVGNGGFSLRSRRLMEACRAAGFTPLHPEDLAIGRENRARLEQQGMRFAPRALADQFSAERASRPETAFGYHGVFNMPRALGVDRFWKIYRGLDETTTIGPDFWTLLRTVGKGKGGWTRAMTMIVDRCRARRRS
ncbi:hypothetical protein FHT17_001695 [Novosphingobium sp. SG916]|nr:MULTISPECIES: DUF5672 family protein [unclassified Novosphingobium]NMN03185.1 hypothetical protein [Novosphingobium sp. SG919]NMN86825.1 hypothetical protein [Novosphingobium sp. SG916]